MAKQRDTRGVTAKGFDVVADPFERGDLIHVAVVAGPAVAALTRKRRVADEAKRAQSIIRGDQYGGPVLRQVLAIIHRLLVEGIRAGSSNVRSAMQKQQHGERRMWQSRRPDVQRQAVLATDNRGVRRPKIPRLDALCSKGSRVAPAAPWTDWLWWPPAQSTHRWRRVGNALERRYASARRAEDPAGGSTHNILAAISRVSRPDERGHQPLEPVCIHH